MTGNYRRMCLDFLVFGLRSVVLKSKSNWQNVQKNINITNQNSKYAGGGGYISINLIKKLQFLDNIWQRVPITIGESGVF